MTKACLDYFTFGHFAAPQNFDLRTKPVDFTNKNGEFFILTSVMILIWIFAIYNSFVYAH